LRSISAKCGWDNGRPRLMGWRVEVEAKQALASTQTLSL
jgi:hypothetical protein